MSQQLKCGLCRVYCASLKKFEEHIRSMLHHRELETAEGRGCTHHCRVCCVNVTGLSAYASHLSSAEHKEHLKQWIPGDAFRELPLPNAAQATAQRDDAKKQEERRFLSTDVTKQVPHKNSRFHPRPILERAKKTAKEATAESDPTSDIPAEQPRSHAGTHPPWTGVAAAASNDLNPTGHRFPPPGQGGYHPNWYHKRQPFCMAARGGGGVGRGYAYNSYNQGPSRHWQDFRYPQQHWHNEQNHERWRKHPTGQSWDGGVGEGGYDRGMHQNAFASDEIPEWYDRRENTPYHQYVDRGKMKSAPRFTRWSPYPPQKMPGGLGDQEMMPEEVKEPKKIPLLIAPEPPKVSHDKIKLRERPGPADAAQGGSRGARSGATARADPARVQGAGAPPSEPTAAASQAARTTSHQPKGAVPLPGKQQQRRESLPGSLCKVQANQHAGPSQHKPPVAVRAAEKHPSGAKNKATKKDGVCSTLPEARGDPRCLASSSPSRHRPSSAPGALLKLDGKPGDALRRTAPQERPWSAGANGPADLANVGTAGATAISADVNCPRTVDPLSGQTFRNTLATLVVNLTDIKMLHKWNKAPVPRLSNAADLGNKKKANAVVTTPIPLTQQQAAGVHRHVENKETSHSRPFSNDCTGGKPPQDKNLPSPSGKQFVAQGGDETNQSPALDTTRTDAAARPASLSAAITDSVENARPADADRESSKNTTDENIATARETEFTATAARAQDKHGDKNGGASPAALPGDCPSSDPEGNRCLGASAQAELSKLGVSMALRKELSRYLAARGSGGSKPGAAALEPNLNQARRRVRPGGASASSPVPGSAPGKGAAAETVTAAAPGGAEAQRRPELERESSSLRPAIQQLLSAPRRNVDWEQIVQVLSKRRQAKGLPRFGIEMGPANKDDPLDPAFLNFDELGDFPELYDLSLDDFFNKERQPGARDHSDDPAEPASESHLACAAARESAAAGASGSGAGRVPQSPAALERTPTNATREKHPSPTESGTCASRPLRAGVCTTTTTTTAATSVGDRGSGGPAVNGGAAATPTSFSGFPLVGAPEVGSPGASPMSSRRPLAAQTEGETDILTDSSLTSGPEPAGGQARNKRRAVAEGPSPEVPDIERKNKRMKVKGLKKERQHVDELLSVSLREEDLSRGMQELEPALEHAKAALHSAFLHVQELLLHKQQITMEMDKLRSYRIQILQGMQDEAAPASVASGLSQPLLIKQESAAELAPAAACSPSVLSTALHPGSFLSPSPLLQQRLPAASHGEAGAPNAAPPLPVLHYFAQPQELPWRRPPPLDGVPESALLGSSRLPSPARSRACTPASKSLAPSPHDSAAEAAAAPDGPSAGPVPAVGAGTGDGSAKRGSARARARAGEASKGSVEAGRVADAAEEPVEDDDGACSTQKRKRLKKRKPARARVPETSDTEQEALTRPVRRLKTRRGSRQGKSTSQASGTVSPCGAGDVPAAREEPPLARPASPAAPHRQEEEDDEGMESPDGNHLGCRQSEPDSSLELVEPPTPEILSIDDCSDNEATELPQCLAAAAAGARSGVAAAALGEMGRASVVEVSSTSDLWQKNGPCLSANLLKRQESEDHKQKFSDTDSRLCEPTPGAFEGHEAAVSGIQIFEGMLYTCSSDKTVRAFDLETRRCVRTFNGHTSKVNTLLVTTAAGNGSQPRLYTGSSDHTVRCYNVTEERCVEEFSVLDRVLCLHDRWNILYAGLANGTVVSISTQSNKFLDTFECHGPRAVSCVASSQEGSRRLLLVGSYDATISVRDARSGLFLRSLTSHTKTVLCMQVVNDLVFSGSSDQSVHAHNIHTGELLRIYKGHTHAITAISILGKVMLTACLDKLVRVYELESHDRLQVYGGHKDMVMCMAVHKSMIYTGCYDGSVQAVTLDLISNFRCWWHKCSLMFGVLDHLKEHIRSTHLSADAQSTLCRWKDCEAFFTAKNSTIHELVPHMNHHAELNSQPQRE